jgi:hypothetical protein
MRGIGDFDAKVGIGGVVGSGLDGWVVTKLFVSDRAVSSYITRSWVTIQPSGLRSNTSHTNALVKQ